MKMMMAAHHSLPKCPQWPVGPCVRVTEFSFLDDGESVWILKDSCTTTTASVKATLHSARRLELLICSRRKNRERLIQTGGETFHVVALSSTGILFLQYIGIIQGPRSKFTDTVLRFILRCVIRSSEDNSYDVVTRKIILWHILGSWARLS